VGVLAVGLGSPEGAEGSDTLLEWEAAPPAAAAAAVVTEPFTPLKLVFLREPVEDTD